jgi:hypothetical protein
VADKDWAEESESSKRVTPAMSQALRTTNLLIISIVLGISRQNCSYAPAVVCDGYIGQWHPVLYKKHGIRGQFHKVFLGGQNCLDGAMQIGKSDLDFSQNLLAIFHMIRVGEMFINQPAVVQVFA